MRALVGKVHACLAGSSIGAQPCAGTLCFHFCVSDVATMTHQAAAVAVPHCSLQQLCVPPYLLVAVTLIPLQDAAALRSLMEAETLDALLLQEHKLQETHIDKVIADAGLQGWHVTFNCSTAKKGYAGVATLCRRAALRMLRGCQSAPLSRGWLQMCAVIVDCC